MNESKKTLTDEINSLFHIYPGDFNRTFKEAIYPIVKAFETALNRDLLLEKEKKNHFFEFDVKEIIRADITERYQAYKLAKETGFMTLNEIRRAENMEDIEGLDVVNVGLGAVLYDTKKHVYYTPNTDTVGDLGDGESSEETTEEIDSMLEGHELAEAYDESGNSAERDIEERYNDVHDSKTGRFGSKSGSGGSKPILKTKYAPSPRRNPKGITVSPMKYARLTGILNEMYPNAKEGDKCTFRDANTIYDVVADGYGGMEIKKMTRIK